MFSIKPHPLPEAALLNAYVQSGAYTDCYATDIARQVSHAQYVEAFYTTALFKAERLILKWVVARPSTDAEASNLAAGTTSTFAAWRVEGRSENQLLLSDYAGRTRSWLMVRPLPNENGAMTRLYFGSAVVPQKDSKTGQAAIGRGFRALLGFHKRYSEALLYAARSRLEGQDL